MKNIVYAGSFDPLTNGHWWVIKSGLEIAEKVIVFVAENPAKKTMFTAKNRQQMIQDVALSEGLQDVIEVCVVKNEYVASKAVKMGANYMIRGIRNQIDFDAEALLQKANTDVIGGAKTIFVMPPRDLDSVSSSFIKSLVGPVGWHFKVKQFLPKVVYEALMKKYIYDIAMNYAEKEQDEMEKLYVAAIEAYFSEDRHYHNFEHIVHCLEELKWYEANREPEELKWYSVNGSNSVNLKQMVIAILGHDIVYGQKGEHSDEEMSARVIANIWRNPIEAISLIRATDHLNLTDENAQEEMVKLMRSIDLAILGQEPSIYNLYKENVRKEYSHYSDEIYYAGRIKVLAYFMDELKNDNLFEHAMFSHYNEPAYENMSDELKEIRQILNSI